jgi:phosphoribosylglycinamide formyltransferase-1
MTGNNRMKPLAIGVLGSGNGTNCQAIINAIEAGTLNAKIVCVLSDVEDAFILERARKHGVPAEFISGEPFRTKLDGAAEQKYVKALRRYGAELVVLAGFMRVVKKRLLKSFPGKVVNVHPALLPSFPGLEAWKQALDKGVKITGCTVHIVNEDVDSGPILAQKAVPVFDSDTPKSLHARIQQQEHVALPEVLTSIALGVYDLDAPCPTMFQDHCCCAGTGRNAKGKKK